MNFEIYKSLWGMNDTLENNVARIAEHGFDGVEFVLSQLPAARLRRSLARHRLRFLPMVVTEGGDWRAHYASFEKQTRAAARFEPRSITAHSSRDWFTFDDQCRFFERALKLSERLGVPVTHETHRTRALFSLPAVERLLRTFPELNLVADFAHLTVVHESLLQDQKAALDLAIARTRHIHGRVGHAEGGQVPEPRAPEWRTQVRLHERWWLRAVAAMRKAGVDVVTFTSEYGPPDYMQALPYTRRPLADVWEIGVWQAERFRQLVRGA